MMTDEWWRLCHDAGGIDLLAQQAPELHKMAVEGPKPP
jgi:hypothetical protein